MAVLADRAAAVETADGEPGPYALLGKWVHMLGSRGHFSSKSRKYSTTLGALRRARRRWQSPTSRSGSRSVSAELASAEEEETTLVIGQWRFIGMGWRDAGETALATAAAGRAREHQRELAQARRTTHREGRDQ